MIGDDSFNTKRDIVGKDRGHFAPLRGLGSYNETVTVLGNRC